MVSKEKVREFETKGGYDIVDRAKDGWATYGLISQLQKATKISRPIIYEIKAEYPIKPSKLLKKYQVKFLDSSGWRLIQQGVTPKQRRYLPDIKRAMETASHFLGDIDPMSWDDEDVTRIRRDCIKLRDSQTEDIRSNVATNLRRAFRAMRKYELIAPLENVEKRGAGARISWYLEEEDLVKMIHSVEECDTLMYFFTGVISGARHSGITGLTPDHVNSSEGEFLIYEPKMAKRGTGWVRKYADDCYFFMLNNYMADFGFRGKQELFRWKYTVYNGRLTKAGLKAGLTKTTSTHIMKHTFVSQASLHNVSLDVISKQTGTDEETLKKFYRAESGKRQRHELRGEEYTVKPFYKWIKEDIYPHFLKRYKELLAFCARVDGIRRMEKPQQTKKTKTPPKKEKKKRAYNWKAVEGLAKSKKASNSAFFQKILDMHNEGLTDQQIRARLDKEKQNK